MFSFWASIFILPQEAIDQMNQICRNYLWGGMVDYKRNPFISWKATCMSRKYGGLGLRNLGVWNKACIAKIVWAIADKKDLLWVRWVHGRYLKGQDWWDYQAPPDCSWYWKKLVTTKELFKQGVVDRSSWRWMQGQYTVKSGYLWQLGDKTYMNWSKIIWARTVTPRHATTTWFFMYQRLPVRSRIARFSTQQQGQLCCLCETEEEDHDHLFFGCRWAKEYWNTLNSWWSTGMDVSCTRAFIHSLQHLTVPKRDRMIIYAIAAAGIYHIWRARNEMTFAHHLIPVRTQFQLTRQHIIHRILTLNSISRKFDKCIDRLLN